MRDIAWLLIGNANGKTYGPQVLHEGCETLSALLKPTFYAGIMQCMARLCGPIPTGLG